MSRIAVDFGTSNTVVARYDETQGAARTVELPGVSRRVRYTRGDGRQTEVHVVPSVIHYTDSQTWVGQQVVERGLLEHADTWRWMKRRIALGSKKRRRTARGLVSPRQAGADFLHTVLTYLGDTVDFASDAFVFTAPVEAFEDFESWLRDVAESLGIRRLTLYDEATACILGYEGAVRSDDRFVVFDFGCGTLDVAAVRLDLEREERQGAARTAVALGRAGRELGGLDVDLWIAEHFATSHRLSATERRRLEPQILAEAERVKIALSDKDPATATLAIETELEGEPVTLQTRYRRRGEAPDAASLEQILRERHFLRDVRETLDRALENAAVQSGLRRDDVKRVVVTGGTSLIPAVRGMLAEVFGDRVLFDRPFDAVVRGACEGVVMPRLQHDYAIESFDRATRDYEFKPLFSRGLEYPTPEPGVRLWARGSYDGMTRIGIQVFEVSTMRRRGLEVSLVDEEGALRDQSRVRTESEFICLNRDNPTFIVADPPVRLERDAKRFLCTFQVDGQRRLLVTVEDRLRGSVLLDSHPVVKL